MPGNILDDEIGTKFLNEHDAIIQSAVTAQLEQLNYTTPVSLETLSEGRSALTINVRSLLANGDKVEEFLNLAKPTVAALQETWQVTRDFPGYQGEYATRSVKRGGGVALLIREGTDYKALSRAVTKNIELVAIEVGKDVFISTYIPPNSNLVGYNGCIAFSFLQMLLQFLKGSYKIVLMMRLRSPQRTRRTRGPCPLMRWRPRRRTSFPQVFSCQQGAALAPLPFVDFSFSRVRDPPYLPVLLAWV